MKSPGQKRIAIFSLAFSPIVGGAEIAAEEIAYRIPEYHFSCFTQRFENILPREEIKRNISIKRIGRGKRKIAKFIYVFNAFRKAEKEHAREPFDALWAIMASYGGIAALLFKIRHPEVPLLLTLQEGDSESHIIKKVGLFYPFWKSLFVKADRIQVISSYLKEFATRHGAHNPIDIVPNGVDSERMKKANPISQTNEDFTIITTSRLVPKNGIDILLHAASIIEKKKIKFKLWILGSGPDEEKLKTLASRLGLASKVTWYGHVPPEQVDSYLKSSDLFVRISRSEGLGSSFLEAMAAGIPVIGTLVGGISDFLKDGETGIAVSQDPNDVAQNIEMLMNDKAMRERIGNQGKKLIELEYSWDSIAPRIKDIFEALLSKS